MSGSADPMSWCCSQAWVTMMTRTDAIQSDVPFKSLHTLVTSSPSSRDCNSSCSSRLQPSPCDTNAPCDRHMNFLSCRRQHSLRSDYLPRPNRGKSEAASRLPPSLFPTIDVTTGVVLSGSAVKLAASPDCCNSHLTP
jgi:hypothetical protein